MLIHFITNNLGYKIRNFVILVNCGGGLGFFIVTLVNVCGYKIGFDQIAMRMARKIKQRVLYPPSLSLLGSILLRNISLQELSSSYRWFICVINKNPFQLLSLSLRLVRQCLPGLMFSKYYAIFDLGVLAYSTPFLCYSGFCIFIL